MGGQARPRFESVLPNRACEEAACSRRLDLTSLNVLFGYRPVVSEMFEFGADLVSSALRDLLRERRVGRISLLWRSAGCPVIAAVIQCSDTVVTGRRSYGWFSAAPYLGNERADNMLGLLRARQN